MPAYNETTHNSMDESISADGDQVVMQRIMEVMEEMDEEDRKMDNEMTSNYTDRTDYSSGQETLQPSLSPDSPTPSKDVVPTTFHDIHYPLPSTRGVTVTVSDALYFKLCTQFGRICPNWLHSKAHFTALIHAVITTLPGQQLFSMRVWLSSPFVIIMDNDGCTLVDVVEECYFNHFRGNVIYRHCMQSPAPSTTTSMHSQRVSASVQTPSASPDHYRNRYHLIYIKPILERLSKVTGCSNITESAVIQIVDRAIRCGAKRQISKRTFAFQWQQYTVIMSKSLKTILDVAWNGNVGGGEVVTVHPDVVSILAKKCPDLDYFAIQELARCAKRTGRFSVKKNEYRQQFTYAAGGYRIVFASNHSTIVEMQRL